MKPVVYLAHPVGAPTAADIEANLARARRWLRALTDATDWSINASWIAGVQSAIEAGLAEADERERGLADMLVQVERCDALVLVGGRVSVGMAIERDRAVARDLPVLDLTSLGEEPPADLTDYYILGRL